MQLARLITGLTPSREQSYQQRLFNRIARNSERVIRREIARAMRDILRNGNDALDTHKNRMQSILSNIYNVSFDVFGQRIFKAVQEGKKNEVPTNQQYEFTRRLWIKTVSAQKVTEITGTTLEQAKEVIQQALDEALTDKLGEIETAKLIRKRMAEMSVKLSMLRSRVIARTESHSASTASAQLAAKTSGLPMVKEWIASPTERTRHSHIAVNGDTAALDEPFKVPKRKGGYDLMMQPGDITASAENVINCRCVVGYSLE